MKLWKEFFGENLKSLRKNKNWSQQELADLLGVEVPTVSRWETGKMSPSAKHIKQICDLYGIAEKDLFKLPETEGIPNTLSSEMKDIIKSIMREELGVPKIPETTDPKKKELLWLIDRLDSSQIDFLLQSVRGLVGNPSAYEEEFLPPKRRRK